MSRVISVAKFFSSIPFLPLSLILLLFCSCSQLAVIIPDNINESNPSSEASLPGIETRQLHFPQQQFLWGLIPNKIEFDVEKELLNAGFSYQNIRSLRISYQTTTSDALWRWFTLGMFWKKTLILEFAY